MSGPYGISPPDAEALAVAYLSPLLAPTPVLTRLPKPALLADMVDPLLRVEAAGGALRPDQFLYDVSIILHGYAPVNIEDQAAAIVAAAQGYGARGQYAFTIALGGVDWYVTHSWVSTAPFKQNDPLVNLARYKGMLTWRIPGAGISVS